MATMPFVSPRVWYALTLTMFDEFSGGYYACRLSIERSDGEHAVMDREHHDAATECIYTTSVGEKRVERPVFVKVDDVVFPVFAADVPPETLVVPDDLFEAIRTDDPPTVTELLVAKGDRAATLLEMFRSVTGSSNDVRSISGV